MPTSDQPPRYQTYLLRIWQERLQDDLCSTVWRFSLEDPHTRERKGFTGTEALCAFLESQTATTPNESK